MRHPLRALALACALTLTPACASLDFGGTRIENPLAAAKTVDQRAYALIQSYAALLEEAGDIVRDPAAPLAAKRAIGRAERIATPAITTLQIAATAYTRAQADGGDLASATRRLAEAVDAAKAPISELSQLIRTAHN